MDAIIICSRFVLMTLTLMQGHSGWEKAENQRCMLLATKQAVSIKLATKVGLLLRGLDPDFATVYIWLGHLVSCFHTAARLLICDRWICDC